MEPKQEWRKEEWRRCKLHPDIDPAMHWACADCMFEARHRITELEQERDSLMNESLFAAIEHGDAEHRAWLKEALECHFTGKPVPAPRSVAPSAAEWKQMAVEAYEFVDAIVQGDTLDGQRWMAEAKDWRKRFQTLFPGLSNPEA